MPVPGIAWLSHLMAELPAEAAVGHRSLSRTRSNRRNCT
jgi:hypothetical protein